MKSYSTPEITVNWDHTKCIHSEKCWRKLPQVFQPKSRPWILIEGAPAETIKLQVAACPSGALSIADSETDSNGTTSSIEIVPNGPALIKGSCEISTPSGEVQKMDTGAALCRCGASNNKPFCDGSHVKIDFQG
ncbi:MAG: (4Fe-4S)-binding protein, partial [Flavobacteriales bacterium]